MPMQLPWMESATATATATLTTYILLSTSILKLYSLTTQITILSLHPNLHIYLIITNISNILSSKISFFKIYL